MAEIKISCIKLVQNFMISFYGKFLTQNLYLG